MRMAMSMPTLHRLTHRQCVREPPCFPMVHSLLSLSPTALAKQNPPFTSRVLGSVSVRLSGTHVSGLARCEASRSSRKPHSWQAAPLLGLRRSRLAQKSSDCTGKGNGSSSQADVSMFQLVLVLPHYPSLADKSYD